MTKKERSTDIILFEKESAPNTGCLKQFLNFLRLQKVPGPPNFSFVDAKGSLLGNLSLRENIALDSIPSTVSATRTFTLEDHLKRLGNPHLWELYQSIKLVDHRPPHVDDMTCKTTALVKGLLQKADFIFLESPERYLDQSLLKVFLKALQYQLKETGQTLLLTSDNPQLWQPLITKTVSSRKCQRTGKLELKVRDKVCIPFKEQIQQVAAKHASSGVLVFNHPKKDIVIPKLDDHKKAS